MEASADAGREDAAQGPDEEGQLERARDEHTGHDRTSDGADARHHRHPGQRTDGHATGANRVRLAGRPEEGARRALEQLGDDEDGQGLCRHQHEVREGDQDGRGNDQAAVGIAAQQPREQEPKTELGEGRDGRQEPDGRGVVARREGQEGQDQGAGPHGEGEPEDGDRRCRTIAAGWHDGPGPALGRLASRVWGRVRHRSPQGADSRVVLASTASPRSAVWILSPVSVTGGATRRQGDTWTPLVRA